MDLNVLGTLVFSVSRRYMEVKKMTWPNCIRDEGRPLASAIQSEVANCPQPLRSRGVVVSVLGKGRCRNLSGVGRRVERM